MFLQKRLMWYGVPLAALALVALSARVGTSDDCEAGKCFQFNCVQEGIQCWLPQANGCERASDWYTSGGRGGNVSDDDSYQKAQKQNYCDAECEDKQNSEAHECNTPATQTWEDDKLRLCNCGT